MSSGALIHVPHYLSNLRFRVWKKMQETLKHSESAADLTSVDTKRLNSSDINKHRQINMHDKTIYIYNNHLKF